MTAPIQTDVAIIGAGTAGIGAFAELGKLGLSRVLINHGPLGTTCARVGCMPSKAVLHAGAQWATLRTLLNGAEPPAGAQRPIDLWRHARATRDMLAGNTAKRTQSAAGDDLLMGRARFVGPSTLDVDGRRVEAKAVIVATGSGPVVPGFLKALGERVLTTDTLFDLDELPASVGMLGLGAIGLEMGLALSRLGVRVVAGDMKALPAGITDPEVGQAAIARFAPELTMWLGQPMQAKADGKRITVSAGDGRSETVDMVLAALGRSPNLDGLDLAAAGVPLDDKGRPQLSDDGLRAGDAPVVFCRRRERRAPADARGGGRRPVQRPAGGARRRRPRHRAAAAPRAAGHRVQRPGHRRRGHGARPAGCRQHGDRHGQGLGQRPRAGAGRAG